MEYTMGVATTPHVCAPCVCGHCDINFSTVFAGFKTPRKGMAISKMLLMEREFMLEALLPAVLLSEARAFILHLSCSDLRFTAPTNRRFPDAVKISITQTPSPIKFLPFYLNTPSKNVNNFKLQNSRTALCSFILMPSIRPHSAWAENGNLRPNHGKWAEITQFFGGVIFGAGRILGIFSIKVRSPLSNFCLIYRE